VGTDAEPAGPAGPVGLDGLVDIEQARVAMSSGRKRPVRLQRKEGFIFNISKIYFNIDIAVYSIGWFSLQVIHVTTPMHVVTPKRLTRFSLW
jgi:hypothetical protein